MCTCVRRNFCFTSWHLYNPLLLSSTVLSQSQAEAHYKGNRHARRVKGIETSKGRPQEGDKPYSVPPTSPSPPGAPIAVSDSESVKAGEFLLQKKKEKKKIESSTICPELFCWKMKHKLCKNNKKHLISAALHWLVFVNVTQKTV